MEYRAYEKINDKIIKIIEDNYLKDFHKEIKIFQIVMAGYNASKYKSLQVFKEHGWEMSPIIGNDFMSCLFKNEISSKVRIDLTLIKNMKTGILESGKLSEGSRKGYIVIKVDETDEIYELIKSLERLVYFDNGTRFGNDSLNYYVSYNEDRIDGYILNVSCPCSI